MSLMTITDAAANHVKYLLGKAEEGTLGLRIGVRTAGCSGMKYSIEYAKDQQQFEEIVEKDGVKVFIDPKATMYLIGTEMDFQDDGMNAGFTFRNPNEKGRCGCGESFKV